MSRRRASPAHQPAPARSGERMVATNGVELCVETFGDPSYPPILLMHGACASMIWWETALCERLAAGGRYVIRLDSRDTGRSTFYPPGAPTYSLSDMARDVVGILDALGIPRAHIVGRSMSGGTALILGVDHADRVLSLTFVGTTTGDDDLPPMSGQFLRESSGEPDLSCADAVVEFIVRMLRAYSGGSPWFDEAAMRRLAIEDVARTRNMASTLGNHFAIDVDGPRRGGFGELRVPALVVHGARDPVFPLPHAHALRDAMPGATLLVLPDAGHELPAPLWDMFVAALLRHTA
jgi:pimeloyl-ACP methyl ester carboxylesterase